MRQSVIELLESRRLLTVTPTFFEATSPTGKRPESIAVADFNKDGKLDFITANANSGTVTVAFGKGTGSFGSQKQIGVGSEPVAVVTADFNKDGKTDFAVALQGTDQVVTYLGDGAGNFNKIAALAAGDLYIVPYASYGTGAKLVTGDFNGDTNIDLAVTNSAADTVSIFLGQNNGQFGARVVTTVSPAFNLLGLAAADLNHDGKTDLVVSAYENIDVLFASGSGQFTLSQAFGDSAQSVGYDGLSDTHDIVLADLTGDGILDLADVNGDTDLIDILKGSSSGKFSYYSGTGSTNHMGDGGPIALTAGDFNQDGVLDLAVANASVGTRTILTNDGTGNFPGVLFAETPDYGDRDTAPPVSGADVAVDIAAGDFNNDGKLDLITADDNFASATVLLNNTSFTQVNPLIIGDFYTSPYDPLIGDTVQLRVGANESNGTIANVKFYLDTDGTYGLSTSTDRLIGTAVNSSPTQYTLSFDTTGLTNRTYSVYAVATDARNVTAQTSRVLEFVVPPILDAFTVTPTNSVVGTTLDLSATAHDDYTAIQSFSFYRESNNTSGLQTNSDTLIVTGQTGTYQSGSTGMSTSFDTTGLAAGTYKFYVIATDGYGYASNVGTATVTLTSNTPASPPVINSFTASASAFKVGFQLDLTTNATETNGTIANVKYYIDTDGTAGLNPSTDMFVGTATSATSTFTLTADTSQYTPGTYTIFALATDANGQTAQKTTVVTAYGNPVINTFTISPSSTTEGSVLALSVTASENKGTINSVAFYRESGAAPGFQNNTDPLIGNGTLSNGKWTITTNTAGLTPGTYTYYAEAFDAMGMNSPIASATVTLTGTTAPPAGALLAWEVGAQSGGGTQGLTANSVAAGDANTLGLTRGSGLKAGTASKGWGASGWAATSAAGITGNKFITFGLTVTGGYKTSLSSIDLHYRRTSDGPANVLLQYQLNNGAWVTVSDVTNAFPDTSSSGANATLNVSNVAALQNIAAGTNVNFRLTPYGATASTGTWYIYNQTGNDLTIKGTTTVV